MYLRKLPSFLSSNQAGDANRQFVVDHFKFGPSELCAARSEWQILALLPLRRDDVVLLECQQVGNSESPDWDGDVDFDWNSR